MRQRPLVFLSTVAAATLLLAGCAGGSEPKSPASTESASSECTFDAKPGKTSDAVVVEGEGADAKVTVPADAEFAGLERTVVDKGDGKKDVAAGDLVSVQYQIVDAATGEVLDSSARGEDGVLPVLMDPSQSSLFLAALECAPLGAHTVLAVPGSMMGEGASNIVVYADAVEELPTTATGDAKKPEEGMPEVELDKDGAPTITIPDAEPPAETRVAVLKEGDGPTVGAGDLVVVQYRGVKWSDGEEFDSTWSRDAVPAQFQTSGVVTGFKMALEGQKVGSQVLVVMPPKDGYGSSPGHELEKESLVFVVDILATTPVQQPAQ